MILCDIDLSFKKVSTGTNHSPIKSTTMKKRLHFSHVQTPRRPSWDREPSDEFVMRGDVYAIGIRMGIGFLVTIISYLFGIWNHHPLNFLFSCFLGGFGFGLSYLIDKKVLVYYVSYFLCKRSYAYDPTTGERIPNIPSYQEPRERAWYAEQAVKKLFSDKEHILY